MDQLFKLWEIHQNASWPESLGTVEGELMMLDTVIAGCVTYFFEEAQLDAQRVGILQDSLSDLENLMPDVPDHAVGYFDRLRTLGSTILDTFSDPFPLHIKR
jgi:hypothetical protein